ncbi:hypothetical protein AMTR_s00055p00165140 [Amborella trichopoda]|uniref:Glycosyltransferase 61 catalytic domain-containing protein n=2 Tax=Amborella trichopoda TaxID=13333 RepID=U5D7S5_AMBTC|nr:hypothetical protein AMTR_s00055p00165140 [Amborella trichopoda]
MNRHWLTTPLLFIFLLNTLTLSFYFLHQNPNPDPIPNFSSASALSNNLSGQRNPNFTAKPWPDLASFVPWTPNPSTSPSSCEAFFGHGFTRKLDLLSSERKSWFRCHYNEALKSSVCEGGLIRMIPQRIHMSNGGESLETVIGREEEDELPTFEPGAFEVEASDGAFRQINDGDRKIVNQDFLDRFVPRGAIYIHTMRSLLDSIRVADSKDFNCSELVEEPTLLITRFEYANLFHTVTDWYSAYVASRVTDLSHRPYLVFVDGHCKAPLEEAWKALFSSLRYAKNFTDPVCFRHVILSPLGYETALFKGLSDNIPCHGAPASDLMLNPDSDKTARLTEFGEFFRASFGFPLNNTKISHSSLQQNVLFVRREDYLAHPRHGGKVEPRLSNEQEVFDTLKTWAKAYNKCRVNIINGLFAHMTVRDQVRAIQEASIIVGAHGAGLTHIIAARPGTVILEIISSMYRRPHFSLISQWRGVEYHAINLEGSYANINQVLKELSSILKSLGC